MKKRILTILFMTILALQDIKAQDQKVYSQFFMNPYAINPAYAGATGYTTFFGVYRQQWVGLEGAPAFSHLSFHTPLENNFSVGALAFNDNLNAIKTSGAKVSAGYLLQFDKKQFLRFGLSVGGGYTTYDVDANIDPALLALSSSSFLLADLGVSYYYENFNVALSVPNLMGRNVVSADGFSEIKVAPYEDLTLQANYRHMINKNLSIEPHLIYRFSVVNLPQYEVAVAAHLGHVIWAGVNYRQDASFGALFGLKIQEKGAIGFAYEFEPTALNGFSSGTMEISLGYQLGDKKKNQKQAISFIYNFKESKADKKKSRTTRQYLAEQRAKAAEERAAAAAAKPATPTPDTTPTETTEETVTADNTETEEPKAAVVKESIDHDTPLEHRTTTEGVWEIGATYVQTRADSSVTKELKWHDALTDTPDHSELPPNTVRKGKHFLELPVGHHVVAAEFPEFQSAEDYSDDLFERGFHGTVVGYVTDLKMYFVVVHKGATMKIAEDEQSKWSKLPGLSHVYILNVVQ